MSEESTLFRRPTSAESQLLSYLVSCSAPGIVKADWCADRRVIPLQDGDMGSLRLCSARPEHAGRQLTGNVAQVELADADGTPVLAALTLDQFGDLFELDIWKVDFSQLTRIPEIPQRRDVPPVPGPCG